MYIHNSVQTSDMSIFMTTNMSVFMSLHSSVQISGTSISERERQSQGTIPKCLTSLIVARSLSLSFSVIFIHVFLFYLESHTPAQWMVRLFRRIFLDETLHGLSPNLSMRVFIPPGHYAGHSYPRDTAHQSGPNSHMTSCIAVCFYCRPAYCCPSILCVSPKPLSQSCGALNL